VNIPEPWEAILLSLAAWRVFQLISDDEILNGPRRYVTGKLSEKWELFLECAYCAGAWVAGAWWVAWLIFPYETLVFAVPWALSAGVIAASKVLSS
jgi:hypothetical protein